MSAFLGSSASDDDYLTTGGVTKPELNFAPPKRTTKKGDNDDLFIEGYGREFGGKLTYSVGVMWVGGALTGGTYGLLQGLNKASKLPSFTPKLAVNQVLNQMGLHGPGLANQAAVMTGFYCVSSGLIGLIRGEDDIANPICAGGLSGLLYKSFAPWQMKLRYGVAGSAFFTLVDQGMKRGWI